MSIIAVNIINISTIFNITNVINISTYVVYIINTITTVINIITDVTIITVISLTLSPPPSLSSSSQSLAAASFPMSPFLLPTGLNTIHTLRQLQFSSGDYFLVPHFCHESNHQCYSINVVLVTNEIFIISLNQINITD